MASQRTVGLVIAVGLLLALTPAAAHAATQTRDDPSDAPAGPSGKADLRSVTWDVDGASAKLTVGIDESTYGAFRADIGVHVLLDTDSDGIADRDIVATRNADGLKVDLTLRDLDRTLSTADCQDLDGKATAAGGAVATTVANGLETFTFSFDATLVPGSLAEFRWAAFGQAPPDGGQAGPWDIMPNAANPDPAAANPGDRRCDSSKSGLSVRMNQGVAFPDADPAPTPTPAPTPEAPPSPEPTLAPSPDTTEPILSAFSLSRTRFRAAGSGPSIATTVGATLSYTLSEAAAVKFRIERARQGRQIDGRCVIPTRSNRRAKNCIRYKTLRGSFRHGGDLGFNKFSFMGRLRGQTLKPGRYRLRGVATDQAGNKSRPKHSRFRIVSR